MRLFVKTRDKTYPIYFGKHNCFEIKKILAQNKINLKKLIVIYDKNIPKKIISKFKNKLKDNENIFIKENEDKVYKQAVTLCHMHHRKLHNIYGKRPKLITAQKQQNWVEIQRKKYGMV